MGSMPFRPVVHANCPPGADAAWLLAAGATSGHRADREHGAATQLRRAAVIQAAEERSLLGPRHRQMGGRFPDALVEVAKRVSGITENTDLLTYALIKLALEDDFGERLLERKGRVPKGTFFAD